MKKVDVSLLLVVLSSSVLVLGEKNDVGDNEKDIKNDDFVPTHEWQPLRKDQAIPRGLHVRLNLETGEREAKLLDPNEHESDNSKSSLSQISESSASNDKFSWEEIKDALHKMEDDGISLGVNPEDIDRVKKKFRSYSELKKELGEVKLDVKTELEVMNQLLEDYQDILSRKDDELSRKDDESNYKELIESEEALLNHLENLVHQTDNANHFMNSNGFKQVVFQSLNSTSWRVRYEATKVFGSAVQSNPKVQIGALENGAIPVFLRTLALDSHPKVKSGALYGISCLIRSFPLAQGQFLEKGGLQALLKQFDSDTSEQLKLQIRSLKLINDLINEIQGSESEKEDMTNKSLYEQELAREKEKQQNSLRLKERLVEQGWCEALLLVLSRHPDDVELVELIANSMINMAKPCSPAFSKKSTFLLEMAEKYKDLIGREEHDYMWIHALFTKLSQLMDKKRDEL